MLHYAAHWQVTVFCVWQLFARFMESAVIWNVDAVEAGPGAEPGFNRFPYYYVGRNEAMSLSGTVNRPRRREGGVTASIASIFSIGSARR